MIIGADFTPVAAPSSTLGLVGALLAAPFCVLISGSPAATFHYGGLTALSANFVAAWLVRKGRRGYGFLFLLPFLGLTTFIAIAVFRQRV
jgi:hypothetical protein